MDGYSLEARASEILVGLGIREDVAREIAAGQDETMGRCVLALYRSAAQPARRRPSALPS